MLTYRKNPAHFTKLSVLLVILLALLLPHAARAGKKKDAAEAPADKSKQRLTFDVRKIVWPNPPAIARIKFLELYTGEKIDWAAYDKKNQKPKQRWMDRLAGTKPTDQVDMSKLPFQLIRTYGVAVDSKGNIYAADQGVAAIFIFNPETKDVQMIRNGKEGRLGLINGLALDDNDRLFVTDDKFREVLVFNPQHQEETAFGADVLVNPGGIAIDTENRLLYVVDTQSDVVDVFDADSLKLLRKIGVPGKKHTLTDPGTFSLPTHVAVDSEGNVYVTDTLNARVEIFDADGNFISQFGKRGDGPGHLERPKGIAVDCDGHVWVVDAGQDRVKVFTREGQLLIYFGENGNYPGQFADAYGIAIDKFNRVITSEQFPGRLQVFRYVTEAEAEQARIEQAQKETRKPDDKTSAAAQAQNSAAH
jgi:DNA-binding beta-propeller fold protein YncE